MNKENIADAALHNRADDKQSIEKSISEPPVSVRPKKKKRKALRIVAFVAAIAVLASASYYLFLRISKKVSSDIKYTEVSVTRGDISKTITGSGAVQPVEEYTVVPTVSGKILTDNIIEGQTISKGDLLYTIDSTNAENTIKQNENALERAQLSYQQSVQTLNNLKVTSDVSGTVTKVYVKNGDQVNANAPVLDVQDASSLTVTVPFFTSFAEQMYIGQSALVYLNTGYTVDGTISLIHSGQSYSDYGAKTTYVDIAIANPGVIREGNTADVVINGQQSSASGTISYVTSKTITAKASGQVSGLTLMAGDAVTPGQTVATLVNDSAVVSAQTAELQVQNAELTLQNAKDALSNYNITSPISGTVIEKNSKAGDTIGNVNSSTSMAVIADMSSLVMTIDVDELDILNIKVGQTAEITADAIPGKTFIGQVTNVSNIGSSSSSSGNTGVTTYAVQITISDYGTLLPGMNVNASIVVDSASDVLLIPEEAVMSGGFVMRKISASESSASPAESAAIPSGGNGQYPSGDFGNGSQAALPSGNSQAPGGQLSGGAQPGSDTVNDAAASSSTTPASGGSTTSASFTGRMQQLQANVPEGYELVRIEIGLTDGNLAEVKSGLSEGDTITYVTPTTSSSSSSLNMGSSAEFTVGMMPPGGTFTGGNFGGNGSNRPGASSGGTGSSASRG